MSKIKKILLLTFLFLLIFNVSTYSSEDNFALKFLWKDMFDYRMLSDYANPIIADDKLYFAVRNVEDYIKSHKGNYNYDFLNIYNIESGEVIKKVKILPGGSMINPIKIGDTVYFARENKLMAFEDDELVWEKLFDSWIEDIMKDGEFIYVTASIGDKNLVKLTKEGEVIWSINPGTNSAFTLEQDNKYIYTMGFIESKSKYIIYKIDKKIGKVVMIIDEDMSYLFVNNYYIVTLDNAWEHIYFFNKKNGKIIKTIKGEKIIFVNDKYLIYRLGHSIICLNGKTLNKIWYSEYLDRITLYKGKLYGYFSEKRFIVMDVKTGKIIWEDNNNVNIDFASGTTPVVNDEYVVTITEFPNGETKSYIWVYKK